MHRFLAFWNGFAFAITLIFWLLIILSKRIPYPWEEMDVFRRSLSAVTYGFAFGDLLLSLPILWLGAVGLNRNQSYGWTATMVGNGLWIYSVTLLLVRDLFSNWSPGSILFIPFFAVALLTTPWLWKNRHQYGIQ